MSYVLSVLKNLYVFNFPLIPVRNISTRAGCYNAFLHQCIVAQVSRHFSIHGEGLMFIGPCTIAIVDD